MTDPYVCVLHANPVKTERSARPRLVVAVREGASIIHHPLNARAPDYEAARAEAQARWPDRRVIVPRLGEAPDGKETT
ncbi:MAG TPA: hypothetical protein VIX41_03540 [Acidimicrobiales bacterium]